MEFRFSSWNVNNRNFRDAHSTLLKRVDTDLLALQEVSASFYSALCESGLFDWSEFSLALRPCVTGEGRSRQLGCAVLGRAPFQAKSAQLLTQLNFPERALTVRVGSPIELGLCSFHIPPGVSWGKIKPQTIIAVAEWLKQQNGHTIFGIDANSPKTDHPLLAQNEWWWKDEPVLLGASPLHDLRDCLRLYLEHRPKELQQIADRRPRGPLAISHVRGKRGQITECRYDFIYVSPGIRVLDIQYLYEEALQAGSDHALVTSLLQITDEQEAESGA